MTNREKALERINEYLAKQEPQKVELALVDDFEKLFDSATKNLMKTEPQYGEILDKSRRLYKEIQKVDEDINLAISSFNILERKAKEIGLDLDSKLKGNRGKLNNYKKTTSQIISELKSIV